MILNPGADIFVQRASGTNKSWLSSCMGTWNYLSTVNPGLAYPYPYGYPDIRRIEKVIHQILVCPLSI